MKKLVLCLMSIILVPFILSADEDLFLNKLDTLLENYKHISTRDYPGQALSGHINGGAEVFHEFGFETLNVRNYTFPGIDKPFNVELYKMSDRYAAEGLFLIKNGFSFCSSKTLCDRSERQIKFVYGKYYIKLNADSKTEEFDALTEKIAVELQSAPGWAIDFSILPDKFIIFKSRRLLRGPIALQKIYPLGDGDLLWIVGKLDAFTADYKAKDGSIYNYIIAKCGDTNTCEKLFKSTVSGLDSYLDIIQKENNFILLKDWNNEYITITVGDDSIEIKTRLKEKPSRRDK